jgi:hypothetical protein
MITVCNGSVTLGDTVDAWRRVRPMSADSEQPEQGPNPPPPSRRDPLEWPDEPVDLLRRLALEPGSGFVEIEPGVFYHRIGPLPKPRDPTP